MDKMKAERIARFLLAEGIKAKDRRGTEKQKSNYGHNHTKL